MSRRPRILLFDSGAGGITVARSLRACLPEAHYFYAADTAAFPYGAWYEPVLIERIVAVIGRLIPVARPDLVVIACNTASTLALAKLRHEFETPFVGTVPAIKPAAEQTKTRIIGVLATPGTVKREYTQALIHTYAYHCRVFLHGAPRLAEIAEARLRGASPDLDAIREEIRPVFRRRDGRRTDTVVLGCTHYPLLIEELRAVAPWPVAFINPAPAIARRAAAMVSAIPLDAAEDGLAPAGTVFFTSPRSLSSDQVALYAAEGFELPALVEVPDWRK